MKSPKDTPRTNAIEDAFRGPCVDVEHVAAALKLARDLERELARYRILREWVEIYLGECESVRAATLRDVGRPTSVDALEHRIARLKETLAACPVVDLSALNSQPSTAPAAAPAR
jgi:hypothetical protein